MTLPTPSTPRPPTDSQTPHLCAGATASDLSDGQCRAGALPMALPVPSAVQSATGSPASHVSVGATACDAVPDPSERQCRAGALPMALPVPSAVQPATDSPAPHVSVGATACDAVPDLSDQQRRADSTAPRTIAVSPVPRPAAGSPVPGAPGGARGRRPAPRLVAALSAIRVGAGGREATVGGRTVTADSPRDLRGRLTNALYEELHAGRRPDRSGADGPPPRRTLRDPALERRLADAVPHATTPVRGRLVEVLPREGGDELVVRLPEATVRVGADRLSAPAVPLTPGARVELALEAARPALSPGFFYVMGSRPLPRPAGPVRRLFVHARDADAAVVLWGAALGALEAAGASYHAKVLSDPQDFPRRDSVVVYLHGDHRPGERAVVAALAPHAGTRTAPDTSVFTEELAPGIAAAWDPEDPRPGQDGMSFGQHRAFALASGLIAHALDGGEPGDRDAHLVRAFLEAGIDPSRPQDNLTTRPGDRR
ncbi:T3SS effector HopA1 family protein [Streptomyces sp. NPDC049099]|uniref:T3SS effector HopA1 family protein n=1 Tax=Streptomyces sp. NPDC049099 TaxID=3155768 RepID=UPI0034163890